MRILVIIALLFLAGVAFAPIGVPLGVFARADLSKVPPVLISAARFDQLDSYAVRLAVTEHVEARGPKLPQPETLLVNVRGRIFSGIDQMVAFALERAFVVRGVQGWEDASKHCFGKSGENLSLSEAAVLVIHMRSPSRMWDERNGELIERRNAFLRGMAADGYATDDEVSAAISSPLLYCRAS